MIGRVVSTSTSNTVTVLVSRLAVHPLYKKSYVQTKKYLADALISIKEGDMVEMIKVRPISKNKHWRITKVVGKNLEEITAKELQEQAEKVIAEVMPEEKEESRVKSQESSGEEVKNEKSEVKDTIKNSKVKVRKEKSSH